MGRSSGATALSGLRVLVTRTAEQGSALGTLLAEAGAEVVELATIAIEPLVDRSALDDALRRVGDYAWVVFTSANGFEHTLGSAGFAAPHPGARPHPTLSQRERRGEQAPEAASDRLGVDAERSTEAGGAHAVGAEAEAAGTPDGLPREAVIGLPRVAVVGRATRAALKRVGIEPSFVPNVANGRGLADELPIVPGERVLLLRSDLADGELPRRLIERGAVVDDVAAYRTVPRTDAGPELRARLTAREIDAALLASPSAVRGLLEACGDRALLESVRLVAIGPTTARSIEEMGLRVAAQAREQSGEGLVTALMELVASGGTGGRGLSPPLRA